MTSHAPSTSPTQHNTAHHNTHPLVFDTFCLMNGLRARNKNAADLNQTIRQIEAAEVLKKINNGPVINCYRHGILRERQYCKGSSMRTALRVLAPISMVTQLVGNNKIHIFITFDKAIPLTMIS